MARVTKAPADEVVVDDTAGAHVAAPTDREYVETVQTADGRVVDREVAAREVVATDAETRDEVLAREKAEFGGMKFGSAFFGWLTAAGTGVLLTALIAAIGTAMGLGNDNTVVSARALGIGGAIALAVVMFVAYLAGGYVAGRMARFSGARQGFAVWLWAIIAAVVLGLLGAVLGARFDVLSNLDAFPRIPISGDDLTLAGIITAVVFAAISLVGAILGGLAGMRYHRRVDRAGVVV
ncbi:MAG TPA: hypothetical protein VGO65_07510 [Pseudolysinimonas sp.]|nr:hypothetical protein [Pseudolysinimonas sp.]